MIRTPQWALTVEKREALLVCFSRIRVSRHPVARQKTVSWEGAHYLSAHAPCAVSCYWLSTSVTVMTLPGAKMLSPGWVPLPESPVSSRSPNWDDMPQRFHELVDKRVETREEWFLGSRLRYKSPPKSPVLKKIKMEISDDTVLMLRSDEVGCTWSGRVVPESPVMMTRIKVETDDDDFTPRCTMDRTFKAQQEHLQRSLNYDTHEWESLAAMLSPPHKIVPSTRNHNLLPPNPLPHNHFERPKNAYTRCLCISCVGPAKAKPQLAACAVCAAQIPYSVCVASNRKPTTPTTVPTMCFACVHAFL